jgi:hypothetical protein
MPQRERAESYPYTFSVFRAEQNAAVVESASLVGAVLVTPALNPKVELVARGELFSLPHDPP